MLFLTQAWFIRKHYLLTLTKSTYLNTKSDFAFNESFYYTMECTIGVTSGAITPPDFHLVGKQYIMPHQIFK